MVRAIDAKWMRAAAARKDRRARLTCVDDAALEIARVLGAGAVGGSAGARIAFTEVVLRQTKAPRLC
jgi:hypothetical protein